MSNLTEKIEIINPKKSGLFTNYIFRAIPLAFDESMSYYECLCGLLAYIKDTVIPTVNNNGAAAAELQEKFVQLNDFVEHYFDNLDVQDEIDNKLDAMVEDGTLQEIITTYLNAKAIFAFDTVADMQASTNLINGSYAKTLGYYSINDGGGALYFITDTTSNLYHQEAIGSSLYANLIVENETINFKQLGAKSNDETYDNHAHYIEYENLCNTNNTKYKLYIPAGIWYSSETQFTRVGGLQLIGNNKSIISKGNGKDNTILRNYNSSQDYYFKIGNNSNSTTIPFENLLTGYFLDGLTFEGAYNNSALYIIGTEWSKIGALSFRMITAGHCINMSSSWEWDVDFMEFRVITSLDSAIYFSDVFAIPGVQPNCSALYFNYLNFEALDCTAIETSTKANFIHNEFNVIECERSFATSGAVGTLPAGVTDADTRKVYTFKGWFHKTTINTINHNNGSVYVQKDENTWLQYLAIFTDDIINTLHTDSTYNNFSISLSNLHLVGNRQAFIVSSHYAERPSILLIGTVCNDGRGEQVYDGDGNNGLALQIGLINNGSTVQYALNCLMDKLTVTSKTSATTPNALQLMTVNNALDISGCCAIGRVAAPIPCDGVKKIHLTVAMLDNTTNVATTGSMRFGYKNRSDGSYTYLDNTAISEGYNRLTFDLSEVNYPEQFVIGSYTPATKKLAVYTINYEY